MATQTTTQRQAAAKRAAATRKRNAAKRSASATKASARRTKSSASEASRNARRTAKQATRTASRRVDEAENRLGAVGRQAQRALLIPVGAAAVVSDTVRKTARSYSKPGGVTRELDKFERRGRKELDRRQRAFTRRRHELEREVQSTRRTFESRANGARVEARDAAEQVRSLI
jgi:hypothetical protein